MIITISGMPGSGKNSVAEALSEKLNFKYYVIGDIRREKAESMGISLEELNKLGEKDPSTDYEVDKFQAELSKKEDNIIIVGRTSFHFIPDSVKVFLDVDVAIGAERILHENRVTENPKNLNESIAAVKRRIKSDNRRYKGYYKIDCYDKNNYDLVIDTSHITIKATVNQILELLKMKRYINHKLN